jgi:hypothetical protein
MNCLVSPKGFKELSTSAPDDRTNIINHIQEMWDWTISDWSIKEHFGLAGITHRLIVITVIEDDM